MNMDVNRKRFRKQTWCNWINKCIKRLILANPDLGFNPCTETYNKLTFMYGRARCNFPEFSSGINRSFLEASYIAIVAGADGLWGDPDTDYDWDYDEGDDEEDRI
jgi:hypothetical protein